MPLFLVMSESRNEDLGGKIRQLYGTDCYAVGDNRHWIVSAQETTKEVADVIGLSGGRMGRGVVFQIGNYYGWHDKALWEWMNLKESGAR